jgi:AraC-like DNA-binding protein/quercetin dioxygenase-like cupin family protein
MSEKRQKALFDPRGRAGAEVTTLTYDYPHGYEVPEHFHDQDQLVYACQGVMTVRTTAGTWVVPAQRAVWIAAKLPHQIHMSGRVSMRTLYLRPRLVDLSRSCCVVNVSPLLRELVLYVCDKGQLRRHHPTEGRLLGVLIDHLESVRAIPLQLPNPTDPRALRIVEALSKDCSDGRTLADICKSAGASKRTIERIFQVETRMTFGKWRQQLRLMQAMRLLAAGEKVTHAALEAGYSTPSAFVSMFKRALGTTPSRYFAGPRPR